MLLKPGMQGYGRKRRRLNNEHDPQTGPCRDFRSHIFKWSEYDIPAADVWKAIGQKPLFGHHSGKQSRTFWACFMKLEGMEMLEGME